MVNDSENKLNKKWHHEICCNPGPNGGTCFKCENTGIVHDNSFYIKCDKLNGNYTKTKCYIGCIANNIC